jgi:hypothetical protein
MADTTFTIKTKSFPDIVPPYATSGPNNWTVGETATFTFEFPPFDGELVVSDSYTAGTEEYYDTITVEPGATLTIPDGSVIYANSADIQGTLTGDGLLSLQYDFAAAFTNFAEWAGSWTTLEMLNSELKYRIQIPSGAGIDSLVWGIEPNSELQGRGVVGVWGLVESIDNERNPALTTNRYSVDVTVLAPIDEYATISDVETDLVI